MISADLTLFGISVLLLLVLFLAIIEVAFFSFSRISIRTYREESWKTQFLNRCLDDPVIFTLPLRIGIQGALIGITVLVTGFFIGSGLPRTLVLTFFTVLPIFFIFREAIPNIIARKNPERVLLALLPAFRVYGKLVSPISRPLTKLVGAFLVDDETGEEEAASEEEVQAFIETGEEVGIREGDEGRMVQSIVDLGDKMVREIMTPRPEIVSIRREATLAELGNLFAAEKVSRIPVYGDDPDHVVGLVFAIDFVAYRESSSDSAIEPLIRKVEFVPETKKVADLLRELQRNQSTLAMVVDEYGGTSGLVSVEDILEEIVGDIHDEFDEVDQEIVEEGAGIYLVSGKADIDNVKDRLQLEVNGGGFETVSGFLLDSLGRLPQAGEVIDFGGMKIEVVDAEGHRVNKVRFYLPVAEKL